MEKDKKLTKWVLPNSQSLYNIQIPSKKRDWMDVNQGHAYKCLPLTVANGFGWEIKNPIKFDAVWNGDIGYENAINFTFHPENIEEKKLADNNQISSHFGNGIITFSCLNFIIRTTKDHNIFLKSPTNHFKHGAQALEAIMETDWLPYTFTINWKITEPNIIIRFEKNEPIACLFPFPRNYIESFETETVIGQEDSEFYKEQKKWAETRSKLNKETNKDHAYYVKGLEKTDENKKFPDHQKTIRGCPFKKETNE
jgi:hypothetical protein